MRFSYPWLTPKTMLFTRVRDSPCSDLLRRSSSGRWTSRVPSCSHATVIGSGTVCDRTPLGPCTVTVRPSMETSTPVGTVIGCLPMRDISSAPLSPDEGEDFPAHALLGGLPVGEQPGGRGYDRYTQATEHLGQRSRLRIDPQTGLGHPAQAGNAALPVRAELQFDHQGLTHGCFLSVESR